MALLKREKHADLIYDLDAVQETLVEPDEVYQGVRDPDIILYYKRMNRYTLVVVAKHLNNQGFVVTVYQTSRPKKKGEKLWPK